MTLTTNTSKAREVAEAIGCSVPTVMNKAKVLGIVFKKRSMAEHDALLGVLMEVRPRPRRTKLVANRSANLDNRIAKHLDIGKQLINEAAVTIRELDNKIENLLSIRTGLVVYTSHLNTEQNVLTPKDGIE